MKIYIVGAGLGAECYLTQYAREKIQKADMVITTKRLAGLLGHLNGRGAEKEITAIVPFIKELRGMDNICVIASGDTGFFSVSALLKRELAGFDLEFVNGLSSLQYLSAKLGLSYEHIKTVSAHGREVDIVPFVCYNKETFILTGGKCRARDVIAGLYAAGLCDITITVGENLSAAGERIITGRPEDLREERFDELAVLLVKNPQYVNIHERLRDNDFIRGKSPMSKEAVRTLSVSVMAIAPGDRIADIGAGTGSMSVVMARAAYEGSVLAIEKDAEAVGLIRRNREKSGAYNINVAEGPAPDALPAVRLDKAFVGGSSGNMREIIKKLVEVNGCRRIVVNAITLETLFEARAALAENGLVAEISCINSARAENIGGYHMMKAENPVYIICGEKTA